MRILMMICAVAMMVTSSQAAIVSRTNVLDSGPAPVSLDLDVVQNVSPQLFGEQQCVELGDGLAVDIASPGSYTYAGPCSNPGTIPSGTIVNSYLVHFDPPGTSPSPTPEVLGCSITFDTPILGLIFQSGRKGPDTLGISDGIVGASSSYWTSGTNHDVRGFDLCVGLWDQDPITLSADRLTVSFDTKANTIDEMRIITEPMWVEETAWATGTRYVTKGNWATYTAYNDEAGSVTLYAGRDMDAGTVAFSEPVTGNVTITITLNEGWRFASVEENIKIQDYDTPPNEKPRPGQFDWKDDATESPFEITVPQADYYGVHVNVEWLDCGE